MPASAPTRWKVIIASDGPWSGEIYQSRAGTDRCEFGSVVELCRALLATTGWSLPTEDGPTVGHPLVSGSRALGGSPRRTATKFIVAADEPWQGSVYATTSTGSGRRSFTGFGELVRAVMEVSGWSLPGRQRQG